MAYPHRPDCPRRFFLRMSRVGAQRGIGVNYRSGNASIELRVGLCGIDLPQEHLAVCPCQIEDAVCKTPVLVFLDKAHTDVPGFPDARHYIYCCRLFRIERDPVPDSDNRIKH